MICSLGSWSQNIFRQLLIFNHSCHMLISYYTKEQTKFLRIRHKFQISPFGRTFPQQLRMPFLQTVHKDVSVLPVTNPLTTNQQHTSHQMVARILIFYFVNMSNILQHFTLTRVSKSKKKRHKTTCESLSISKDNHEWFGDCICFIKAETKAAKKFLP